ncbi:MAG TPA: ATP-binding protein [Anaeromyxobacter sp.]|nr:ATP-binding protein [Anaeromyxobacter sp.]
MVVHKQRVLALSSEQDVVVVRQEVRRWAVDLAFSLVEQTKLVTAASELARNAVQYGGGGEVRLEAVENGTRRGLRLVFEDRGPGIPDVPLALRDGYTTGNGLGLGLGGAKRLVNDFEIKTAPGEGTRITVARWR